MSAQRAVRIVWAVIAGFVLLIAALLGGPLRAAWHCYWLHENAPREQAVVLAKLEAASFALRIEEGPHAGEACTADTSYAMHDATEPGAVLEVVYVDWKPGTCELASTIEASAQLLWFILAGIAAVLAALVGLGVALQRSFLRPGHPPRLMQLERPELRCPACGKAMDEGYVPLLAGISWRRLGEPVGMPHALQGLPGTVGWRGRPRLHAFRCVPCEVLTLQYGKPTGR